MVLFASYRFTFVVTVRGNNLAFSLLKRVVSLQNVFLRWRTEETIRVNFIQVLWPRNASLRKRIVNLSFG